MAYFRETQSFSRWWTLIILMPMTIPLIVLLTGKSNESEIIPALIVSCVVSVVLVLLFLLSKLETRIDSSGFHYRYFPYHRREHTISSSDIVKIWVRKYDPIGEYGGWGIRYGMSKGRKNKAYNTKGNIGIQIELADGRRVLFGTQQPQSAQDAIHSIFPAQAAAARQEKHYIPY